MKLHRLKEFCCIIFHPSLVTIVLVLSGMVLTQNNPKDSGPTSILIGEHELRSVGSVDEGFFLFKDGTRNGRKGKILVKFSWKMHNGAYVVSEVPLEKVQLRFDNSVSHRSIRFTHDARRGNYANPQEVIDDAVSEVTFTVRDGDWPPLTTTSSL